MADVSKFKNSVTGEEQDIKDAVAREEISELNETLTQSSYSAGSLLVDSDQITYGTTKTLTIRKWGRIVMLYGEVRARPRVQSELINACTLPEEYWPITGVRDTYIANDGTIVMLTVGASGVISFYIISDLPTENIYIMRNTITYISAN